MGRHRRIGAPAGDRLPTRRHYQPPQWPDPDNPQHLRLDVKVDDLDKVEAQLIALGATPLPGRGEHYRVLADPVGASVLHLPLTYHRLRAASIS